MPQTFLVVVGMTAINDECFMIVTYFVLFVYRLAKITRCSSPEMRPTSAYTDV
jgi:hypothetical protein